MNSVKNDLAGKVFDSPEPPCFSLYQPTHRSFPDNQQDPVRFKNLVRDLETKASDLPAEVTGPILEKIRALADDRDFWNHAGDGLAILASPTLFRVYKFARPVPELTVVANTFHIKPLIRMAQSADGYHVLALSRHDARLFEGDRDALFEIDLPESFPRTITEALGEELTEPHQTVASYAGAGQGEPGMYHGHGSKESEVDIDAERYFRAVDRAVADGFSKPSKTPLILVTLPEHRAMFREVSHNPHLLEEGPDIHPESLDLKQLRSEVWKVLEPRYIERLSGIVEEFGTASANEKGHSDRAEIARAVIAGRVKTLLVEAEKHVPGHVNPETGAIEAAEAETPADDVLDDLSEMTLAQGGEVIVVPAERMPVDTGAAAIYRF
jgi:hypothetical protein